jgi:ATP-binding cassette subfamily B (MDR/TAP) protein 1
MSVICQALSTIISSTIIGLIINWKLSLLTIALMPLIIIGTFISTMIVSSQLSSDNQAIETASKIAIEAISNIRTVVSLNKQNYFLAKYTSVLESKLR